MLKKHLSVCLNSVLKAVLKAVSKRDVKMEAGTKSTVQRLYIYHNTLRTYQPIENHIFGEIRPCSNSHVYFRFNFSEVFGTFLCVCMSISVKGFVR